jgi:hypothetical protein
LPVQVMDADSDDAQQPGPDSIMTGMLEVADDVHDCDRLATVRFAFSLRVFMHAVYQCRCRKDYIRILQPLDASGLKTCASLQPSDGCWMRKGRTLLCQSFRYPMMSGARLWHQCWSLRAFCSTNTIARTIQTLVGNCYTWPRYSSALSFRVGKCFFMRQVSTLLAHT